MGAIFKLFVVKLLRIVGQKKILTMTRLVLPLIFAMLSCVALARAGLVQSPNADSVTESFSCKNIWGASCEPAIKKFYSVYQTKCPTTGSQKDCRYEDETMFACTERQALYDDANCWQCVCPYFKSMGQACN